MKRNFAHNAAIALLTITTSFFAYDASAQRVPLHRSLVLTAPVRRALFGDGRANPNVCRSR